MAYTDDMSGKASSVYAYTLNDAMLECGVLSVTDTSEIIPNYAATGIYPSGVIYADIINFDNNENPYLVIFRADQAEPGICVDIYRYNAAASGVKKVATLAKGYTDEPGAIVEFSLGFNESNRYIVYNEYVNDEKVGSEYYTVIDGTAYRFVCNPDYAQEASIVGFNSSKLLPCVDITAGNHYLNDFFSMLKNRAAASVTYEDIYEQLPAEQDDKLETVLSKAALFRNIDIGTFADMYEYNEAMTAPDVENRFYSITNLYDLGEEMYYVRFATDHSFYNYAVLRRTDSVEDGYQILAVRTDSIPLSDVELESLKEVYSHNKLVYKKAKGSILDEHEPIISIKKADIKKPLSFPKIVSKHLRKPIGLIGGGLCLACIVAFWFAMLSEEEK